MWVLLEKAVILSFPWALVLATTSNVGRRVFFRNHGAYGSGLKVH